MALALALPPPELLAASLLEELEPMFPPKARLPPEVALAAAEPLLLWLLDGVVGVYELEAGGAIGGLEL